MEASDRGRGGRRRWLLAAALVLDVAVIVGLLAARRTIVPVVAWQERQWSGADQAGEPRVELLTRHPRVRSPYYGFFFQPGDVVVEWSGHLVLDQPAVLATRLLSTGRAEIELGGRRVASVPGRAPQALEAAGSRELPAGPVEIRVRAWLERGRGSFRGWLAERPGEWVPLEDLAVTPRAHAAEAIARATAFRRTADRGLIAAGIVALALLMVLLRSDAPHDRRLAETALSCLLLGWVLLSHHGPALGFWGSAGWSGAATPVGAAVVALGLAPWALWLVKPRWIERIPEHAGRVVRFSPLVIATATLIGTWLMRQDRVSGDGWLTIDLLSGRMPPGPFGPFFWKEPLDRLLAVAATRVAEYSGSDARAAIAATSCLAGAWAAWTLARHHRLRELRGWEAAAIWTAGATLLFFGHVENYSWVTAALLAFLLAARHVESRPFATGLLGGLAIAFHPVAAFQVAPALAACVVAVWRRPHTGAFTLRLLGGALVPPLCLVAGAALAGIALPDVGFNRFADDPSVLLAQAAAFSSENLMRVANLGVMILSPGILLGLAVLAARPSRWVDRDHAPDLALIAAALGAIVHLVFLDGKIRPPALDWDLYAPAYVPFALLAGGALARGGDGPARAWATGVSAALLVVALMS